MVHATARGTVFLYTILPGGKENLCHLNDVLFVPKVTGVGLNVSFDDNECRIARADGLVIAVGKKVGSLLLGCQYGKPSRNLCLISWVFLLFFSVSGKVLPVTPLLSGVFVHRVFCVYFVRF